MGTAVLVITIMAIGPNKVAAGLGPIIVGMVIFAVGFHLVQRQVMRSIRQGIWDRVSCMLFYQLRIKEILTGPMLGFQFWVQSLVVL